MTVRGCERRIVHLKNPESEVFEEAFFILKDQKRQKPLLQSDLVREANRIVLENSTGGDKKRERFFFRFRVRATVLPFIAGALLSGIVAVLLSLL